MRGCIPCSIKSEQSQRAGCYGPQQSITFVISGANIESLAVGLNVDKALFTIVVTGNKAAVANLVKQLAKLVKVGAHPQPVRDLSGISPNASSEPSILQQGGKPANPSALAPFAIGFASLLQRVPCVCRSDMWRMSLQHHVWSES